jgi:CO/xanthine dehydrogenase FAD-binding subunit
MPQRSRATEQVLDGLRLNDNAGEPLEKRAKDEVHQGTNDALIAQALQALRAELQPEADLTHSVAAKQHLAGVLLKRALKTLLVSHHTAGSPRVA